MQSMVLYTDGGYRANNGGWGVHGYLYNIDKPKKSSGNSEHILTTMGYMLKSDVSNKDTLVELAITPIHYIDGYGSVLPPTTNNVAELLATINGLLHAQKYDITEVQVFTDSEYVRKGLEFWVAGWKANGWKKQDQTEPANIDLWKELVAIRDTLVQRGTKVKINWIKGHDDLLGNVLADRLATAGVMSAINNKIINDINTTAAEGYWKYTVDKHPMLFNRRMYFNTMPEYIIPGEYYLGDHGKDDDMLGKRVCDGSFSVVILEKPDMILELVRSHQSVIAKGTDSIIMARLDHLYRATTHQELSNFGISAIEQANPYRLDLCCLDREPLTRELRPPKLAMRAVESVSELALKLKLYLSGDLRIVTTDITSVLYEREEKTDKKGVVTITNKLKAEYIVGYSALHVDANYQSNVVKAVPITLTLGIDMLDRNALKRLETMNPKVTIISWLEANEIFRYATVVEAGNDKGIYAGVYSNLRIV
jgi:ribonuclease HI